MQYIQLNSSQSNLVPIPLNGKINCFIDLLDNIYKGKKSDGSIIILSQPMIDGPQGIQGLPGVAGSVNAWSKTGSAGTDGGTTNFIGTTDDQNFVFKRNSLFAGYLDSATRNTYFGVGVNAPNTAHDNAAYGYYALNKNLASWYCTATGAFALQNLIGNDYNTATGYFAGNGTTQSFGCTYIGALAGSAATEGHYYSLFLGYNSGSTQVGGSNNIYIGANVQPNVSTTASSQLNIGDWIYGNGGKIGIGVKIPNASAILDITSTTGGVLFPRLTTIQVQAIVTPANGLTVYNTTLSKMCIYQGAAWNVLSTTLM